MSSIFDRLRKQATEKSRRILLAEHHDERVIDAARLIAERGLATPVLIECPADVPAGVEVLSHNSEHFEQLKQQAVDAYCELRKASAVTQQQAKEYLDNPVRLAAMLLRLGVVDGGVAGSVASTADVLRAGISCVGLAPGTKVVSSFFLMELLDKRVLTYADCAVIPSPDSSQLTEIALVSARSHEKLTAEEPRVALLSFSTLGSAEHESLEKIRDARLKVAEKAPHLKIDGELQFDAAFIPQVAERKAQNSQVAGQANVMVFPDLNAGNIAYKITERIGNAKAVGPLIQGLAKPWMDLSRGCSVEDIVDVAVIAAVLAD